jgi:AMP-binding enzyme/Condensation domain
MSLLVDPTQLSQANGGLDNLAPKGRRWGSRPASVLLGKEHIHGYSTQFENPRESSQASLSLTPIQRDILRETKEPQWLIYTLVLPSETAPSLDRIQLTWQALAAHNPILRSTLVNLGASVDDVRVVVDNQVSSLRFAEVSGYAPGSRTTTIPPYAVFGIRETGEPSITLHIPRVLVDEYSLRLVQRDFAAFYGGQAFADHAPYSAYVQDVLNRDPDIARAYWNEVLDRAHHEAPLFDTVRAGPPSNDRHRLSVSSDAELLERLVRFERRTGFERHTVLQAAWALVLAQHQSTEYVLFATTTRDTPPPMYGGKTAIGRMDVRFPISVHFRPEMSIVSLLSHIQMARHEGAKHAFIGFKTILGLSPSPSLSLQSCLKFVEGTGGSSFCVDDDDFYLTLRIALSDQIRLTIQYDAGIADAKVRVLLDHCLSALEHVLRLDTETELDVRVDLIGAAEREFILQNALPSLPLRDGLVHALFEEQVARTPDNVAVQFETGDSMTYVELNRAANTVARQLPCGPGSIVPVYMNRSIELVVSLLAVLKSGAAYVTLDPDFPMERSEFIIKDVSAPFVLTHASLASRFHSPTVVRVISSYINTYLISHASYRRSWSVFCTTMPLVRTRT